MKRIRLICVGKIKADYWKDAFNHYLKLVSKWKSLECIEVRDGNARLDPSERMACEGDNILSRIGANDEVIGLHESGKVLSSRDFAAYIQKHDDTSSTRLTFIIGGPFGLDRKLLDKCAWLMSLSAMTLPHELARVVLMEQIFRAESIIHKSSYHN